MSESWPEQFGQAATSFIAEFVAEHHGYTLGSEELGQDWTNHVAIGNYSPSNPTERLTRRLHPPSPLCLQITCE